MAKRRKRRHSKRWYRGMRNRILFGVLCLAVIALILAGVNHLIQNAGQESISKSQGTEVNSETTTETETEKTAPDYLRNYDSIQLDSYYVYGTHFNLTGSITLDSSQKSLFLYIVPAEANSPADYADRYLLGMTETVNEDGTYTYSYRTSEKINEGICLETMKKGEYYLVIAANGNNGISNFYSLKYTGNEEPITYYTLTDISSKSNNLVAFQPIKEYCNFSVEETTLPEDVYDVVIDAGHGGNDVGAVYENYYERDIALSVALRTKAILAEAGYKVLLTRDGSEGTEAQMAYTMYDTDGRVNVACRSKAKYAISIHLNSNEVVTTGGVQMYCSQRGNTSFAKRLADAVVSETGTVYSRMETGKIEEGVYNSKYTADDLAQAQAKADKYQYELFNITEDTDALFMIRELGGIATNAFMDGRNPIYGANEFYNVNYGVESSLTEIGFLSVADDRSRILGNEAGYAQGLANGITAQIQAAKTEDHIVTQ